MLIRGVLISSPFLLYSYDLLSEHKLLSRNLRTVLCGLRILYNYKIAFDEHNFMDIHEFTARDIYETCHANDGLYVKFGQGMAANAHLLPPPFMRYMKKFQDEAKEISFAKLKPFLEAQLGRPLKEVFSQFEEKPVASASVAQVHRARLLDGTEVAVKVQKPSIKHQFAGDMSMHWLICAVLDYAFDLPLLVFQNSIEQNLRKELDFSIEERNAEAARTRFAETKRTGVYIPKVFSSFTTRQLMVSEWIDGIKISEEQRLKKEGYDPQSIIKEVVEAFAEQIFFTGFVHCDPHPGNVFVRKRPDDPKKHQIVILDHGLCIQVHDKFRMQYAAFWKAMFTNDSKVLRRLCESWGVSYSESFVSSQLMRPYKEKQSVVRDALSPKDIYQLQGKMKTHLKDMFVDSEKFPREILYINRNMMLIKSLNRHFGSIVDRAQIMALFASRAVAEDTQQGWLAQQRSRISQLSFWLRLKLLGFKFKAWQWAMGLLGVNTESYFQDRERQQYENRFRQYGFQPIDRQHLIA